MFFLFQTLKSIFAQKIHKLIKFPDGQKFPVNQMLGLFADICGKPCFSFRTAVGAHGGERKTACQGAFMFISLTVGSVS